MFAGLLLTRLADLPTAGILEDITLAGWVTGSLVTAKVIYQGVLPTSRVPLRKYFFGNGILLPRLFLPTVRKIALVIKKNF